MKEEEEEEAPPFRSSIGQSGADILEQLTVPVVWLGSGAASGLIY